MIQIFMVSNNSLNKMQKILILIDFLKILNQVIEIIPFRVEMNHLNLVMIIK